MISTYSFSLDFKPLKSPPSLKNLLLLSLLGPGLGPGNTSGGDGSTSSSSSGSTTTAAAAVVITTAVKGGGRG